MYRIVSKRALNPTVTQMEIEAPLVAEKARAGHTPRIRKRRKNSAHCCGLR